MAEGIHKDVKSQKDALERLNTLLIDLPGPVDNLCLFMPYIDGVTFKDIVNVGPVQF